MTKPDDRTSETDRSNGSEGYGTLWSALARFFAARNVRREDVDDLVQDSFLTFWAKRGKIEADKTRPYLFGIAKKLLLTHGRRISKARRDESELKQTARTWSATQNGAGLGLEDESLNQLNEAVAQLPDRLRQVITLLYLEGCSVAETARQMGVGEASVPVYEWRARARLQAIIEKRKAADRTSPQ